MFNICKINEIDMSSISSSPSPPDFIRNKQKEAYSPSDNIKQQFGVQNIIVLLMSCDNIKIR